MCLRFFMRNCAASILLLLAATNLKSQDLSVRYLGIEDGLSNNVVTSIYQDHNGFMWFGTYDGLNRYDGYGFKLFRNIIGDSTSLSSNGINALDEDALHQLWICGQKEVNIYNPVSAKFIKPSYTLSNGITKSSLNDNVVAVKTISGNKVLVGTQHYGLFLFENAFHGRQVPLQLNGKEKTDYYVDAIDFDRTKNTAYVFIGEHGLFTYDFQKKNLHLEAVDFKDANCVRVTSTGKLWIGTNNGLYLYDEKSHSYSKSFMSYKGPVVGICEDKKSALWIASDGGGVWLLEPGKKMAEPLPPSTENGRPLINSNAVYAIFEDRDQRKWVGTLRGGVNVIELRPSLFKKIIYQPAQNSNPVKNFILSFCEDGPDKVWIGTDGAGLRYWNKTNNSYENFLHDDKNPSSISSNFITSIIKDAGNNIWLSTWFGGINKYNRATKSFQRFDCYNTRTKSDNSNVWQLMEDSRHRLWATAVRNGGLFQFNAKTNKFEEFDNELRDLQCIAEDRNGNIWAGDYSSLILIDTIYKTNHRSINIGYTVRCIYEDSKRNFWIGAQEGGLLLYNRANGSFKRYTTVDGLPSNTILRVLEDKKGNLWLSTYNGLCKFDPASKGFRNFSQSDGLQSNQFSYNAALRLSNGEFLFGGIKGFNIFYPDSIITKRQTPEIILAGLKVNNAAIEDNEAYVRERNFDQVKKIVVPYDQAMLSLGFLALDYSNAANIKYAYHLKGWDKHWNYVDNIRGANYSRLQEGDYVFEVRASSTEGIWGEPQQLLYITVLPPWYRTWWAYALYILVFGSAVYIYTLYKSRQAKLQYQIQLANLEIQKEKELNEKKIAFFTNVSHEFRTPLSLIINPIKDLLQKAEERKETGELKIVYRNAKRLLRLVDQLLLFKKAEEETNKLNIVQVNLYDLCREAFLCFTEQARSKKIKYELQSEVHDLIVSVDREKIEIAVFNILSNAFKYTPDGGSIIFKIEEQDKGVKLSISDTGPGIPASESNKLFERFAQVKGAQSKTGFGIGLYLVKNFVDAHKGKVYFTSEEGKGTTFFILLNKIYAEQKASNVQPVTNVLKPATEKADLPDVEKETAVTNTSSILSEISEEVVEEGVDGEEPLLLPDQLATDKQTLLIIDDDSEIRHYLVSLFNAEYKIYQADNGRDGVQIAKEQLPDLILSDIVMKDVDGLDLCQTLKQESALSHIPIILLTGSSSDETQLKAMNVGADDYIKKPFDKDILIARVKSILKRRNILQNYFYNEITLGSGKFKVSPEYKDFIEKCMKIIEDHLQDDQFSIKILASEIGMSHSNLYKKIKAVSGQSVNSFIRFIRLKKAAELFINTEMNVNETANMVGFYHVKYFRLQFSKLFGMNPSDYIKKFRKPFHNTQTLDEKLRK
jgi:signal transduction histidine kinase/ligand-binding sensor domain-containing protein/DNA-binding response OmpR family regulator